MSMKKRSLSERESYHGLSCATDEPPWWGKKMASHRASLDQSIFPSPPCTQSTHFLYSLLSPLSSSKVPHLKSYMIILTITPRETAELHSLH